MKTNELIKELKQFGKVEQDSENLYVNSPTGLTLGRVGTNKMFDITTDYRGFVNLNSVDQVALFHDLYVYVITPLDQRKDEPRFIVHLYPGTAGFMYNPFVERDTDTNRETRFRDKGMEKLVTYFTLSEYEQIQDEADRAGFILPDYDAENTAMFVPVKDGDEK